MIVTFCERAEIAPTDNVHSWLQDILVSLILDGADTFYLGGYGAFRYFQTEREDGGYGGYGRRLRNAQLEPRGKNITIRQTKRKNIFCFFNQIG